jgi:hypothetical protein
LEEETKSLTLALRGLGEKAPAKRRRPSPKSSSRAGATKRAPRGRRREQFLAVLAKKPGAKATEIGAEIGIASSQALARHHKGGAIRNGGKGNRLTAKARA